MKELIEASLAEFALKVNPLNRKKCEEIACWIVRQVDFDQKSVRNHMAKQAHERKYHPIRPVRGEVYMAEMGCNVGFEFKNIHPVLIIQNDLGNIYADTTIVLPITDDDGEKFDPNIHARITNKDIEYKCNDGRGLDKDPSKLKIADITTIDKARLNTRIGKVFPEYMKYIEGKLKKALNFG